MKKLLNILFFINIGSVLSIDCLDQNYYISNQNSLNQIENCTTIHGNLIINSGYTIDNFSKLKNLRKIKGYLSILDNHNVSTLYGLHNIKSIEGNNLYLNLYSVVIKYNINERNDTHEGLCYADNVIWDGITNHSYDIRNNGINCPSCHEECLGCWGPGPNLCQNCVNFNYNGTCVPHCPGNYTNFICDNILPSPPIVNGSLYDLNNIYINWSKTNINDFVSGYKIWLNDDLYYSYQNNDLGYYYNTIPNEQYITDLNYNYEYNIKISYINQIGESLNSSIISITTDPIPTTTPTSSLTSTPTSSLTTTYTSSFTTTQTTSTTQTTTQTTTYNEYNTNNNRETNNDDNGWNNLYLIIIIPFILIIIIIMFFYCKYKNTHAKVNPSHCSEGYNNNSIHSIAIDHLRSHQNNIYESNHNYSILNIKKNNQNNSTEYNNLNRNRVYNNNIYDA